jgi:hypothetical protein
MSYRRIAESAACGILIRATRDGFQIVANLDTIGAFEQS